MSQAFANIEVAMLIELRQLLDDRHYQDVIDKTAGLATDGHFSSGNADIVRLLSMRGIALLQLSRHQEALGVAQDALSKVKGTDDNLLIAELQSTACRCLADLGRINEAEREYRDLIATYRRIDDSIGVIRSLNRLSRIHFIKGQYSKAIDYLLEAIDYARAANDVKWQAMITGNLGTILNLTGEFHRALEFLTESLELNRSQGNLANVARTLLSQAFAQMHLRKFAESESLLSEAEQVFSSTDNGSDRISLLQYRAQLAQLQGDYDRAIEFAANALSLANAGDGSGTEQAQIGRLMAEAHFSLGNYSEARRFAGDALIAAENLGERVEIAACRRVLAMSSVREGDSRMVDAEFGAIVRILDEVGARYELAMSYEAWSLVAVKTAHVREHRAEAQRILRALQLSPSEETDSPRHNGNGSPANAQLVGAAPSFVKVISQVDAIADSEIPVLLLGETGVGKDQIARYIHHHSSRNKGPFVDVNCGTIVHELAETILFGHERGSFTNAVETKVGMVEAASGGTLFLNEVGELPLRLQVKLLSALEEKQFYRVGGTVPRKVDIRIIAATNVDLHEAVKCGRFRADLFYRLAVMTLKVPRLAERNEDILRLFEHFMRAEGVSLNNVDKQTLEILYAKLKDSDWTGNVRELRNEVYLCCVMEKRDPRAVCLRMIARLTKPAHDVTAMTTQSEPVPLNEAVEAFERSIISAALAACGGIIRRAATYLGLPEATLRSKMKKYRINPA